ncbi:BadF/BadG/BcrA/BcrD ATPase family protein [Roseiterribacter gracilis]|uniref:N-acetylglucosamine kinase n=1 Tax=Roseiterribacter gracilis TaxID=2812848 RepID=A0A8S8XFE9_9PROT|nr:N-acetylglucosamine kinase [Rhodospirillales bacterium TMPK1]
MGDPTFFLGIDGGGSRCRARLTDESGKKLGEGITGAANIRLGLDAAWSAILGATDQALSEAGLNADILNRIHAGFGLAGVCGPADVDFLLSGKSPFASVRVETDAHTACLGAFAGGDGGILIIGTGSVGYALIGGVAQSIGGWGFEISDDGSGAAMGRAAIRAAVRAHDGLSAASGLTNAVLAKLGPPARIVEWASTAKPGNYASFAPLVLEHALQNDTVALEIIRHGAARLDAHIKRLLELGAPQICLMGGAAGAIEPFLADWARASLVAPKGDAMDGALLLARRAA